MTEAVRLRIIVAVVFFPILTVSHGCHPTSGECAERLIEGRPTVRPDGTFEELQILVAREDAQRILDVLVRGRDWRIVDAVIDHVKNPWAFKAPAALDRAAPEIIQARGQFLYADIIICRGDMRGLVVLGDLLRDIEDKMARSAAAEDRSTLGKKMFVLTSYLRLMTGRSFDCYGEYAEWVKEGLPELRLDMSKAPYTDGIPPRLVRRPS